MTEGRDVHGQSFLKARAIEVCDAEARRLAEHFLARAGAAFPSQETLKAGMEEDTAAQLSALDAQHAKELEILYEYEADAFHHEQLDLYQAYEAGDDPAAIERYEARLAKIAYLDDPTTHTRPLPGPAPQDRPPRTFESYDLPPLPAADLLRGAHQDSTLELRRILAPIRLREAAERAAREKKYPQTIAEYRAMTNPDIKNQVVRVLTATPEQQIHLLRQYQWSLGDSLSLQREYSLDDPFQAEMKKAAEALNAIPSDPRLRSKVVTPR